MMECPDDLLYPDQVRLHCLMDALEDLEHNCLECPCFDACFDPVMELVNLPFSDFPLKLEE